MTSVAVVGASGLIGHQISLALRDAGYRVYGIIRNKEHAARLQAEEILPVTSDLSQAHTYNDVLKRVSAIIDATGMNADLLKTVIELNKHEANPNYQHQYIATSGLLFHDASPIIVSEKDKTPSVPDEPVSENDILLCPHIRGNVIRPGGVYGLDGGAQSNEPSTRMMDRLFGVDPAKDFVIYGQRDKVTAYVHVKDLAQAYVKIFQHGVSGKVYDVGSELIEHEFLHLKALKLIGYKGNVKYEEKIPDDMFYEKILDKNVMTVSQRIKNELGWAPRRVGLLAELDLYHEAWKAQRELKFN